MKVLNRRTVLRGMLTTGATVSIGLPLLEAMLNQNGTALAQSDTPLSPLYATWFFGNGTLPGLWKPSATGAGSAWSLSPQLTPLADFKSHLTVISGLEGKLVIGGSEHPTGSAAATTASPVQGDTVMGPSIDQVVADTIAGDAPFRSIELGVTPATPNGNPHSLHTVSHSGPNNRNDPEYDPRAAFARLFDDFEQPMDDGAALQAAALARARGSVLDSVLKDGARLQASLGSADRQRVEQHLEAIRAVERRIDGMDPTTTPSACGALTAPTIGPDTANEAPPELNTAMAEIAALALACERTRVETIIFTLPAAHVYYRHLADNMNADFHDTICHTDAGDASNQPRVDTGVQYTMRCLGEFLQILSETPHGASTLLDETLVYVTSDTAWGKVHDPKEWPVLLAGKAGGRLRGDEHHNFQNEDLSRVLLTIAQGMGCPISEFGVGNGLTSSALPGIFV